MYYIKVQSLEHLDELLEKRESEYVIRSGILRSSKNIEKSSEGKYFVYHYIDDTEDYITAEELKESNVGRAIANGTFYCESTKDY